MANRMCCIAVVMVVCFLATAVAQDCTAEMTQMSPCLTYLSGPDITPPSSCCQGIMTVNSMSPACLCTVIGLLDQNHPSVNATKAYALPKDCNIMVDTASCPALSAPPLPGFAVPPGAAVPPTSFSAPPGFSVPPGLSFPPGLPPVAVPPGLSAPPVLPPVAVPPGLSVPPGLPPVAVPSVPPGVPPVAVPPPTVTPPATGPSTGEPVTPSAPGPGSAGSGTSPAPAPRTAGASAVRASMVFCAALTGALALFL